MIRRAYDEAEASRLPRRVSVEGFGLFATLTTTTPRAPDPTPESHPLDDALLLVFQAMERRTLALFRGDEQEARGQFELLKLATADYHQLRAEADAASVRAHDAQVTAGHTHQWASLPASERRAQRERWQERLRPIVLHMARVAAGDGITASDVISRGITEGVLNGERSFLAHHPKVYSWVGHWLLKLAREGVLAPLMLVTVGGGRVHARRKSERGISKGNKPYIFVEAGIAA